MRGPLGRPLDRPVLRRARQARPQRRSGRRPGEASVHQLPFPALGPRRAERRPGQRHPRRPPRRALGRDRRRRPQRGRAACGQGGPGQVRPSPPRPEGPPVPQRRRRHGALRGQPGRHLGRDVHGRPEPARRGLGRDEAAGVHPLQARSARPLEPLQRFRDEPLRGRFRDALGGDDRQRLEPFRSEDGPIRALPGDEHGPRQPERQQHLRHPRGPFGRPLDRDCGRAEPDGPADGEGHAASSTTRTTRGRSAATISGPFSPTEKGASGSGRTEGGSTG